MWSSCECFRRAKRASIRSSRRSFASAGGSGTLKACLQWGRGGRLVAIRRRVSEGLGGTEVARRRMPSAKYRTSSWLWLRNPFAAPRTSDAIFVTVPINRCLPPHRCIAHATSLCTPSRQTHRLCNVRHHRPGRRCGARSSRPRLLWAALLGVVIEATAPSPPWRQSRPFFNAPKRRSLAMRQAKNSTRPQPERIDAAVRAPP